MVPQTVMVAPESVQYQQIPAQYGVRNRVEMVSPGYSYYTPVAPRCGWCGKRSGAAYFRNKITACAM